MNAQKFKLDTQEIRDGWVRKTYLDANTDAVIFFYCRDASDDLFLGKAVYVHGTLHLVQNSYIETTTFGRDQYDVSLVGRGVRILNSTIARKSTIGDHCRIEHSRIFGCTLFGHNEVENSGLFDSEARLSTRMYDCDVLENVSVANHIHLQGVVARDEPLLTKCLKIEFNLGHSIFRAVMTDTMLRVGCTSMSHDEWRKRLPIMAKKHPEHYEIFHNVLASAADVLSAAKEMPVTPASMTSPAYLWIDPNTLELITQE